MIDRDALRLLESIPVRTKEERVEELESAIHPNALKRLAEMRLLAIGAEGRAILGITDSGKRVLLGLLHVANEGMRHSPALQAHLSTTIGLMAACVTFEELSDDVKGELEALLRDGAFGPIDAPPTSS